MAKEPATLGLRIGDILRKAELITDDQLASAVTMQKVRGGRLGEILVSLSCVTEGELLDVLSRQMGIAALRPSDIDSLLVPEAVAAEIATLLVEEDLVFPLAVDYLTHELGLPPPAWIVGGVLSPPPRAEATDRLRPVLVSRTELRGIIGSPDVRTPASVALPRPTEKMLASAANRPTRRRIAVLLIEPDRALRSSLALLLASDSHTMRTAGTVAEALAAIDVEPLDVLVARSPNLLADAALTRAFRARNPFGEFRVVPPLGEKVFGERVDGESLFRFFFNCFDTLLSLLAGRQNDNRAEARAAAEIAREVARECGLAPRGQDEVFLAIYVEGIDETLTSHGYPPGTVVGAAPNSIALEFLESAACPYDLGPLLARAPVAPGAGEAPESMATRIVRVMSEYRRLVVRGGGEVPPREVVKMLERLDHDSRVTMALVHALERRAAPGVADGRPFVLLVDTDPEMMSQIEERLAALECVVQVVSDGNEALAFCQRQRVALVISETDIPGMDGFRLCAALKRDASTKSAKFFFVTREAESEKIRHGLEVGADDYLIKPPNLELLHVKAARVVAEARG